MNGQWPTEQSRRVKPLYRQARLPLFQNRTYDTAEEARSCPHGDVELVQDPSTGLVFNRCFEPGRMAYNEAYQNEQATSASFRAHLDQVAGIVGRTLGRTSITEIGCGKGFFLEMLLAKGFDATGFDPAYEGNNPRIAKEHFRATGRAGSGSIILRHVLEHIPDPVGFLWQVLDTGSKGRIYIEVPCFDWICRRRAWFDIFYEHVNYFRASDFRRMFDIVVESGWLFGGQYLYVVAELATLKRPEFSRHDQVEFPRDFLRSLKEPGVSERSGAIWGASSKGVTFALLMQRAGARFATMIDINPAKQGRYVPSTALRVQSPEHALAALDKGSTVYVMNSNYMDEIRQISKNAFRYVSID